MMKKAILVLTVAAFLALPVAASFAQTGAVKTEKKAVAAADVVKGEIVSIDTTKNEIVIKDAASKDAALVEKTIVVDAKEIGSFKVGDKVKVTLKAGTNTAEKIVKVVKKTGKHKK